MNPSMNFVPAFQQGCGPGYEHMAPAKAAAAAHGGAREHRFSPYVDNGGDDTLKATHRERLQMYASLGYSCVCSLCLSVSVQDGVGDCWGGLLCGGCGYPHELRL